MTAVPDEINTALPVNFRRPARQNV